MTASGVNAQIIAGERIVLPRAVDMVEDIVRISAEGTPRHQRGLPPDPVAQEGAQIHRRAIPWEILLVRRFSIRIQVRTHGMGALRRVVTTVDRCSHEHGLAQGADIRRRPVVRSCGRHLVKATRNDHRAGMDRDGGLPDRMEQGGGCTGSHVDRHKTSQTRYGLQSYLVNIH